MKIYNTLTRKIEEFKPAHPPEVSMYTCGMTVYDHTTVGHMRTYVNTDFLRRTLEYLGFKIKMVENVTDVGHLTSDADTGEDKLQKKAEKEKKTAWDIAKIYEKEFYETLDELNILRPTVVSRATDNIPEMIQLITDLEGKGFTYIIPNDGVYFNTSKFPEYGKIARIDKAGLKAGARIEMVEGKRNATDFALWKFSPENEKRDMEWESPWAKRSFPGWHIECSVMSMKFLTKAFEKGVYQPEKFETIDLHTGGEDHLTIHHPNEIAQSEASTGKQFVKHWFHNRFLMIDGAKMSKSLGNFYTLQDIKNKGYSPLAVRYLFATAHYRQRLNFTWEALAGAQKTLDRLYENIATLRNKSRTVLFKDSPLITGTEKWRVKFTEALANDLNLPQAMAVIWEMIKSDLDEGQKLALLLDWDKVLGLKLGVPREEKVPRVSREVENLVEQREMLRKEGKWEEADKVRKEIEEKGFLMEDTESGPKLKLIRG